MGPAGDNQITKTDLKWSYIALNDPKGSHIVLHGLKWSQLGIDGVKTFNFPNAPNEHMCPCLYTITFHVLSINSM